MNLNVTMKHVSKIKIHRGLYRNIEPDSLRNVHIFYFYFLKVIWEGVCTPYEILLLK